jgi:hypothetical protein
MADKVSDLSLSDLVAPKPATIKMSEIRDKFPMYSDMSDDQLLIGLRQKYYADIPIAQFVKRIDYDTQRAQLDPTKDQSFLDNALQGAGRGMASIGRALGANDLLRKMLPGLPQDRAEAAQTDKPLMNTTGGQVGNAVGQAALVAPTAFIPGANTYVGAAAIGGLTGLGTTEGDINERLQGAKYGALGGLAGKAGGDLIGWGANKIGMARAGQIADRAASQRQRIDAVQAARDAGYVLPPADANPTKVNELLNGLSGKIKTAQEASAKNQPVTNELARKALNAKGPLNAEALNAIRSEAGKAYEAVASTGTVVPPQAYTDALDEIVKPYLTAAKGFPNAKPSPVIAEIEALRSPQFDASSAVEKIKTLRADADAAYIKGDKSIGKALKAGADALEGALDSHLVSIGAPADMLKNFRDARTLIAKTYSVQKGLNSQTGDVSAQALARQLEKGKPLSGELLAIAQTGSAFPKATQALKETPKALSPLDFLGGLLTQSATQNPLGLAAAVARPAARSVILSKPYQALMAMPKPERLGLVNRLLIEATGSPALRAAVPGLLGLVGASNAPQK